MAESEIKDMIPASKIEEIKKKDPKPLFKVFAIGHEGEAKGNLIGTGNIVKKWFRFAVQKLHEKVQMGLRLFHGHNETNDTEGRIPIAEVVGKKIKEIDNKLTSMVACWIYPSYKHTPLDVASIEADIKIEDDPQEGYYVSDVGEVTAIALGKMGINTPGFAGATLLGELQAFADKHNIKEGYEVKSSNLKLAYKLNDRPLLGLEIGGKNA